jgi:hypothetical protein
VSWFQQNAPGSATPYVMGKPSPTPYAAQRMSPTPYPGATMAAKAGLVGATKDKKGGGLGGFLAAPFANPFGKEKRGAVKDILTSNPFGSKARGAVGTVTGLWGGNEAPRGGTVGPYQPPATIGAMAPPVTMRGPDGSTRQVSLADVQKYRTMGAEVVG